MTSNIDPLVPAFPKLENLFDMNACKFEHYEYSIECCTQKYIDHLDKHEPRAINNICINYRIKHIFSTLKQIRLIYMRFLFRQIHHQPARQISI